MTLTKLFLILCLGACLVSLSCGIPARRRQRLIHRGAHEEVQLTTTTTTTPEPPPVPFKYAFAAGRAPGGKPDRYVEQEGDEKGVIKGSYAYLDPNWKWQKVGYVADEDGFHITDSSPGAAGPEDTPAVAAAKARHQALFQQIAERHRAQNSDVVPYAGNEETEAVKQKRQEHAEEFQRIAEEHARIAAEQSRLSSLALQFGEIYE